MQNHFEIVEYNPAWNRSFLAERERIKNYPFETIAIEHVGSTAIPGQWAKPVIDIFIAVSVLEDVSYYESILLRPHYSFVKTGMKGRLLFAKHTMVSGLTICISCLSPDLSITEMNFYFWTTLKPIMTL